MDSRAPPGRPTTGPYHVWRVDTIQDRGAGVRTGRWALSLDQVWAVMAVVLPLMVVGGGLAALDLAYHIRAGDLMLESGHLIRSDSFSYTAAGELWRDQQWAAQVLLALAFRPLGWLGFSILKVGLTGIVFAFLYLACRAVGARPRTGAVLTLAATPVVFGGLPLRPQLFGVVLFAATLWIVAGRHQHPGRLWAIPVIVLVWANLHGSFLLGPLLLGLAWIEDLYRREPGARRTLLIAAISAAAATVNPFGLWIWVWAIRLSTNPVVTTLITEWQPPSIRRWNDAVFFLSVAAVGAYLARRGRPAPATSLLALGVFLLLALVATRNVLWWGLVAPVIIAGLVEERHPRRTLPPSGLHTAIAASVALVLVALASLSFVTGSARRPSDNLADAPLGITGELEGLLVPGDRIFNAQRWGSWFEVALPGNPIFVDSRPTVFPKAIWRQYVEVSGGADGWDRVLDRWEVRVVAAEWTQQERLIPLIGRDAGWREVYRDDDGVVFVRA